MPVGSFPPHLISSVCIVRGRVRVRTDALIVFVPNETRETSIGKREFFSKLLAGSTKDFSLFSWADKGQWETVNTSDVKARRDADWFRIGFEPLFADFTQAGSWFIVYTLMEVRRVLYQNESILHLIPNRNPNSLTIHRQSEYLAIDNTIPDSGREYVR